MVSNISVEAGAPNFTILYRLNYCVFWTVVTVISENSFRVSCRWRH